MKSKKIWLVSCWNRSHTSTKWQRTTIFICARKPRRVSNDWQDYWVMPVSLMICKAVTLKYFGRLPKRGECIELNCRFTLARRAKKTGGK